MTDGPSTCLFSPDRRYRYRLDHRLPEQLTAGGTDVWIMCNPSTADEAVLDPTLRRVRGFATRDGYTRMTILNLWALRSPDPAALLDDPDPVGPDNDLTIARVLATLSPDDRVVLGWGAAAPRALRAARILALRKILRRVGVTPWALGVTAEGQPRHPLYVPASLPLQPMSL